jgi:hypothetical protein
MREVANAIAEALPLFFLPDDVLEIRLLNVGKRKATHAGWIVAADIPKHAERVAKLGECASGVYFTPQLLKFDALARGKPGTFPARGAGEMTSDADVESRRYLIIDVDPARPAGVCATDAEKAEALGVADKVRRCLDMLPAPLIVDSGNGWHLYYRLPSALPGGRCDSATDPLARLLAMVANRCDAAAATVDRRVYNASRIVKVPGTWARKGENTAARPHRRSKIIEVPESWKSL